jgi:hypothetical protein
MSRLYDTANFFVWHPERAWSIAAIFFVLFVLSFIASRCLKSSGWRIPFWPLLIPAIGWAIFGLLELSCKIERANIRIDLFITWPVILGITAIFSVWWGVSLLIGLFRFFSWSRHE